jgi:hypothetical protein
MFALKKVLSGFVFLSLMLSLFGANVAFADSKDSRSKDDDKDRKEHNEGYGGHHDKVEICHNSKTIEVAQSAVASHLAHGDKMGECKKDKKDDKGKGNDDRNRFISWILNFLRFS